MEMYTHAIAICGGSVVDWILFGCHSNICYNVFSINCAQNVPEWLNPKVWGNRIWSRTIDCDNNIESMLLLQPVLQHHIVIFPDLWVESFGNVLRTIDIMICEMQQSHIYRHYPRWQMLFDSLAIEGCVFIRKLVILQPHI